MCGAAGCRSAGIWLTEGVRAVGLGLIARDFTESRIEVARGATRLGREDID